MIILHNAVTFLELSSMVCWLFIFSLLVCEPPSPLSLSSPKKRWTFRLWNWLFIVKSYGIANKCFAVQLFKGKEGFTFIIWTKSSLEVFEERGKTENQVQKFYSCVIFVFELPSYIQAAQKYKVAILVLYQSVVTSIWWKWLPFNQFMLEKRWWIGLLNYWLLIPSQPLVHNPQYL